jgi:diguanylate cyclase (GGDEF)-like protein/PAS domain S-box-containing protein
MFLNPEATGMPSATKRNTKAAPGTRPAAASAPAHEPHAILQALLDYLPSGVTLFGPDLEMITCNAKLKEILDFPDALFADGLPSMPKLLRFNAERGDYGPGDPDTIYAAALDRARKMEPHVFERVRPDGTVLEIRGTPLPGGGFVSIYTDITARTRAAKALRDSEAELRLLIDNVPGMILYINREMRCVFANKRYADFFGLGAADIIGKQVAEVIGYMAYQGLEKHFRDALAGRPGAYHRLVERDGSEPRWLEVKLVPRPEEQGQISGFYSMATDITEQKQSEARIQYLAHHDNLTGLPNRVLFNDRLGQAISLAKRDSHQFALLYLDLDRFKLVNDSLGHHAGDELLKCAADRIRQLVRESDTVARIGGDEFAVILRDIGGREAVAVIAEKIIGALTAPFDLAGQWQKMNIGVSIGIGVYPADGQDIDALIKQADTAMYSAKTRRSCYVFSGPGN